jgi:hypothetical protein
MKNTESSRVKFVDIKRLLHLYLVLFSMLDVFVLGNNIFPKTLNFLILLWGLLYGGFWIISFFSGDDKSEVSKKKPINSNKVIFIFALIFLFGVVWVKEEWGDLGNFIPNVGDFISNGYYELKGNLVFTGASKCKKIVEKKLRPLIEDLRKENWSESIIEEDMNLIRDWYSCTYLYEGGNSIMEVQKWVDNQGMSEMDIAVNTNHPYDRGQQLPEIDRDRRLRTWEKLGIVGDISPYR